MKNIRVNTFGSRPVSEEDKQSSGMLYDAGARDYFQLEPTHFTIVLDNELVTLDVDVEAIITWSDEGEMYEKKFRIPAGFQYDGASIPKAFWGLIGEPDDTKFLEAALVHDYMYGKRMNRKLADGAFLNYLRKEGVWGFKAKLMWAAVRVGGFSFYAGDTSVFWRKVRNFFQ